jgi:hypothetical protein
MVAVPDCGLSHWHGGSRVQLSKLVGHFASVLHFTLWSHHLLKLLEVTAQPVQITRLSGESLVLAAHDQPGSFNCFSAVHSGKEV